MILTNEQAKTIYEQMFSARIFEEHVDALLRKGMIHGTAHLAVGEEATAAGGVGALCPDDYIMSSHRGHAHCIAKGADLRRMMCELLGKREGYCKGLGGSMHIVDISAGNFGANGVMGPSIPMATGVALAIKKENSGKIILDYFGDGTSNSGLFHEALNMAALWKLPIVYLCENNLYGLSTHVSKSVSVTDIAMRAKAYGMPGRIVDGMDVLAVMEAVREAADRARRGEGPTLIEAKTYRYLGHSKSDKRIYRSREEEEEWKKKDPIPAFARYMLEQGISKKEIREIEDRSRKACDEAVEYALAADPLTFEEAKKLVFTAEEQK